MPLPQTMTLEEFLLWEDHQEQRHQFDGTRPSAMAGGTAAHAAIQRNIIFCLTGRLVGSICQAYGSDLKLLVAGHIRYADAFVVCTPVPLKAKMVSNPAVVFEVLSESSAHEDYVVKNSEYRATPSIQRYIILQQSRPAATVFSRQGDAWSAELVVGAAAELDMPEIGVAMLLSDLYTGLLLDSEEA